MPTNNVSLFLMALSAESHQPLLKHSAPVKLPSGTVLYEAQETPGCAYFMTSGMAFVVKEMIDGGTDELGVVGREGVIGGLQLMGPALAPSRCFMQLKKRCFLFRYRTYLERSILPKQSRSASWSFLQEQMIYLVQIAGCHRLHEAEQRLARWLLMVRDCSQGEVLKLTQQFLGMMLGSRRITVSTAAGALQTQGLIDYQRGQIKIIDRAQLESVACDCYQVAKQLYTGLYSSVPSGSYN